MSLTWKNVSKKVFSSTCRPAVHDMDKSTDIQQQIDEKDECDNATGFPVTGLGRIFIGRVN